MRAPLAGRVVVFGVWCFFAFSALADDGKWEWVTPSPQGHDLFAAAVGDGVSVGVGQRGAVITSTDGVEWLTSHTDSEYALLDVVWGNGVFVAVGGEVGFEFSRTTDVVFLLSSAME